MSACIHLSRHLRVLKDNLPQSFTMHARQLCQPTCPGPPSSTVSAPAQRRPFSRSRWAYSHTRISCSSGLQTSPIEPSASQSSMEATASMSELDSMEDMTAYVEKTLKEEERIRRKREAVELQMLRMGQQEAVRRQQAIKLKLAVSKADAALTATQLHPNQLSPSTASASYTSPASASTSSPVKRKISKPKSRSMTAMAAAAGVLRVPSSTTVKAPAAEPPTSLGILDRADLMNQAIGEAERPEHGSEDDTACEVYDNAMVVPKPVFIMSDCTGESAARTVRAALNQFELRCRTNAPAAIMIYRFLSDREKALKIIKEAAKENALVVFTLVDPNMVQAVLTACKMYNVRYVDLWSPMLEMMEEHLHAARSGVPATERTKSKRSLSDDYFQFIEAVEYTRKMDDGANPKEWKEADLLILGVSRCGKTPLSIYLGQRGYKVANLPLVPNCPVPKELYEIDQSRIVGLIIDPQVLSSIRRNRINTMGVIKAAPINYADLQMTSRELIWAKELYNKNPEWPILDVTFRGIEETAAKILKILNDRRGDASPQWVEALHHKNQAQQQADNASINSEQLRAPEMIFSGGDNYLMQGLY